MVETIPGAAIASVASGGHDPAVGTQARPKLSWDVVEEEGLSVQQAGERGRASSAYVVVQALPHRAAEVALHGQQAVGRGLPL